MARGTKTAPRVRAKPSVMTSKCRVLAPGFWRRGVLLLVSTCTGCGGTTTPPAPTTPTRASYEAWVKTLVHEGNPPSVSVALRDRSGHRYDTAQGRADGVNLKNATRDTAYRWFSVTKVFTAAALMQLAERGLVQLDAPAARYLPEVASAFGENARHVTLERLLSHSAGLGDIGNDILGWIHFEGDPHLHQRELVRRVLPQYARFEPSWVDQGHYSNLGYMLLSAIIEVVTGRRYEQYVQEELLVPLGMKRSAFWYDALPPDTAVARGSHPNDFMGLFAHFLIDMNKAVHPAPGARYWFNRFYPDQTGPSGLLGTASDLARFGSMIAAGGQLDGVRVLSEDSVRSMTKPRVPVVESPADGGPYAFALGWFVSKDPQGRVLLEHGGSGMGFVSRLTLRPADGRVAAVVSNDTYLDGVGGGTLSAALLGIDLDPPYLTTRLRNY